MIVWLNGTFGAGKTTVARELSALLPDARLFDAEHVGYLLQPVLTPVRPVDDFQHWRPWRELVVATAARILDYVGGTLVVPQTVLHEAYWVEIRDGLAAAGIPVRPFLLHGERAALVRRIEGDAEDPQARGWRLDHLDRYEAALPWLRRAAEVVDTTATPAAEVARLVAGRLADRNGAAR